MLAAVTLTVGCAGDQDMELPAPLYGQVPIEYPLELWDQDIEGMTLLKVRVTNVGGVDSIMIEPSDEPLQGMWWHAPDTGGGPPCVGSWTATRD